MRTIIELAESIYREGERVARSKGVTVEEFIIRALERELEREPAVASHRKRVTPPLLPSKEPGTLNLQDFNFDELLDSQGFSSQ
jgi:hypothetical protein